PDGGCAGQQPRSDRIYGQGSQLPGACRNRRRLGVKVALLGSLATAQRERLEGLVTTPIEFVPLVDETPFDAVRAGLSHARAAITMRYDRSMPEAPGLELLQVGGAGYDAVDLTHLPPGCQVCNAF